jgi:hypothetical protein
MTIHRPDQLAGAPLPKNAGVARSRLSLVAAATVLGALTAAGSSAAAAKPQTLNVLEVDTSFVGTGGFTANGNKPPAVGQGVVITGSIYKFAGHKQGRRAGRLHIECTFTDSAGTSVCTAVFSLPAGKLVVSGLTPGNSTKPYTLPILGGSGRYTHAKGHIKINTIGNSNEAIDTIVVSR